MSGAQFWMVTRSDGSGKGPVVRYSTLENAIFEAKRLAQEELVDFVVLESTQLITVKVPPSPVPIVEVFDMRW